MRDLRIALIAAVLAMALSLNLNAMPTFAASLSAKINYDRIENTDIIPELGSEAGSLEKSFGDFFSNKGEFYFWRKFKPLNMLSNRELFSPNKKNPRLNPTREETPSVYNVSLVRNSVSEVAQKSWEELYSENANRADFLYAYAMYLKTTQDYGKALAILERATAVDPNYALGYFLKGDIYRQMGQYKNAILSYVATVRVNPYCTDAYFNIAVIFEDFNQPELALDYYRFAYVTSPKDVEIRNSIIRLQRQLAKV